MKEILLTSSDGNFTLVSRDGIGMNDTPWEGLSVISQGIAEKHVVEVRLNSIGSPQFEGNPVKYKYNSDCEVSHGMRSVRDSLSETAEYIKVLQEALDFAYRVNSYIENHDEWRA